MSHEINPSTEATAALALELHGADYYPHLLRVRGYFLELAARLPEGTLSASDIEDGEHAALLHDSIEDGYATYEALISRGYSFRVLSLINGLTRIPGHGTYQDKMEATAATGDIVLILAKLSDNRDNSDPWRIAELPDEKKGIVKRYRRARRTLFNGLVAALRARGVGEEDIISIERWLGNKDTASW